MTTEEGNRIIEQLEKEGMKDPTNAMIKKRKRVDRLEKQYEKDNALSKEENNYFIEHRKEIVKMLYDDVMISIKDAIIIHKQLRL